MEKTRIQKSNIFRMKASELTILFVNLNGYAKLVNICKYIAFFKD